jgi:prepilin-type N-terminal cleavage/methylation domain-containing protein
MIQHRQQGFTVVELLITLFVAGAFLVAGYQLYNAIIKDGGQTRAEARASNLAYDYLRRYSPSATNPCVAATPLTNSAVTISGLTAVTVTVAISCPYTAVTNISKIDVTVLYNIPQQTMKYSTYVKI